MSDSAKNYQIRLLIDSQLEQVSLLCSAVRGITTELRLSAEQAGQLELILVEAVNNVIEHAYGFKAGNDVQVRLECEPNEKIRLIISDQGRAMSEEAAASRANGLPCFPEPESLPEGGWGLGLVTLLADSFHYEKDASGNHLYVSKLLV